MRSALDRTRQAWADMRYRCTNPNSCQWKNYGGRGIKVCDARGAQPAAKQGGAK